MNKAAEILKEIGFIYIYVYHHPNDEFPQKIKTSDIEDCSYYYENSYDVRFSRN
jgi:hypothetical protein